MSHRRPRRSALRIRIPKTPGQIAAALLFLIKLVLFGYCVIAVLWITLYSTLPAKNRLHTESKPATIKSNNHNIGVESPWLNTGNVGEHSGRLIARNSVQVDRNRQIHHRQHDQTPIPVANHEQLHSSARMGSCQYQPRHEWKPNRLAMSEDGYNRVWEMGGIYSEQLELASEYMDEDILYAYEEQWIRVEENENEDEDEDEE